MKIDGAADPAFRSFPIERDPVLGWRLHLFDMATTKALALSSRLGPKPETESKSLRWAACSSLPRSARIARRRAFLEPAWQVRDPR